MIEDDYYRASTQYRYWSYTPQQLSDLRQQTNGVASEKVKAAFRRARAQRNGTNGDENEGNDAGDTQSDDIPINTLTVEEELKIVEWGCNKIIEMGETMKPRVPGHVVTPDSNPIIPITSRLSPFLPKQATAIQYLRRFYLTNSPMTYHPKAILLCCLFLACKADHHYLSLSRFIKNIDPDSEAGISEDDVKAPEFLLLQGLRFTLEVRHAFLPLRGGVADLLRMGREGRMGGKAKEKAWEGDVGRLADKVKSILKKEACLTDVYFLFTPSQIWLGALMHVDRETVGVYLQGKFEEMAERGHEVEEPVREMVVETVGRCAEMLASYRGLEDDKAQRKEMNRIGKKLNACQNPEKADIVAVARAKAAEKREGSESDADLKTKKRKLERQKAERDGDVFGGDLKGGAG